jgi:flavin-dependent dehydrogenase
MTDADRHRRQSSGAATRKLLSRAPHTRSRLKGYGLESGPIIRPADSSRLRPVTGAAWLAVGDAACALDPLSAQGVYHALDSGLRAAQAIEGFFAGDHLALPNYAAAIEQGFDGYLRERARSYRREARWPEACFWRRRSKAR